MNKDLRPEDFWPEAEKLLDNHYNARRKRRAIMWFIAALTIIGASIYFISDRRDGAVVVSESGKQVNTKSEENFTNRSEVIPESYRDQMSNASNVNVAQDDNLKEKREKKKTGTETDTSSNGVIEASIAISTNEKTKPFVKENNSQTNSESVAKSEIKTNSSEPNTVSPTISNLLIENIPIASLSSPLFAGIKVGKVSFQNAATHNSSVKEPKISGAAEYRFNVLAGANLMTKEISGYVNPTTEAKRNDGESNVITPQLSLEVSRVTNNYSIALGLNYIQYGEKVNYDATNQIKIAIDNSYWNTYTTNVLDTDTNYVYGYVYYSQQTIQRQDSSFVNQTDTVEQTVVNGNILKSTGTNVISYVELPISVSYYFGKKKFRYGVSAGVSAGILVYSKGYYLNNAGVDVININDEKLFKKIIFNGQLGLDFRYCFTPNTHFLLRPQYRMNLESIFKDQGGPSQKYSSFGVSAGISFLIK